MCSKFSFLKEGKKLVAVNFSEALDASPLLVKDSFRQLRSHIHSSPHSTKLYMNVNRKILTN